MRIELMRKVKKDAIGRLELGPPDRRMLVMLGIFSPTTMFSLIATISVTTSGSGTTATPSSVNRGVSGVTVDFLRVTSTSSLRTPMSGFVK